MVSFIVTKKLMSKHIGNFRIIFFKKANAPFRSRRLFFPAEGLQYIYLRTSCSIYGTDVKTSLAMFLFPFDMFTDIILYKRYKIKVFIINFSPIIRFISVYLIFCKHIASMKLFLNFLMTHMLKFYYIYNPIILL